MTVDITRPVENGTVSIESDVCMDDGTIIAPGPTVKFSAKSKNSAAAVFLWSKNFDDFLDRSAPEVVQLLSDMVASQEKTERKPRIV